MTRKIGLTLDCANAPALAQFWKLALGYEDAPPPPPFTSREEWLAHYRVPEEEWDQGAWLHDPTGAGPRLSLLQVPEPKIAKNRLHIDVKVGGDGTEDERWARITEEADRLVAAGASVLQPFPRHHIVMSDPEGNEFCLG
ncbi:MAG TPA: VOC family protein [Chloroflexota bacterium]|nr:VOC family protein [Chloroflexota bacterium]